MGLRDVTVTATGDNTMNIDYAVRLALAWARTGLESVNQRFRMPALTDEI